MSAPKVLKHGEHTRPQYAPAAGQTQSWAGKSTDEERKGGQVSGIVKRYSKKERASTTPVAMGWIKARCNEAIEYTGSPQNIRGMSMLGGAFGLALVAYVNWGGAGALHSKMLSSQLIGLFLVLMSLAFSLYITVSLRQGCLISAEVMS